MKCFFSFILFIIISSFIQAQNTGTISGTILDKNSQESLIGAAVTVAGTELGASTEVDGSYLITGIPVGSYNLVATYVGYETQTQFNIVVTSGNDNIINFQLEEGAVQLEGAVVTVNRSISITTPETPNSIQRLSSEEIKANPGGNFDISRTVQSLPGVAGAIGVGGGFRNDIIIRGGAPNENVYYLDGIEVPNINHFSTQGSAGGPQGMLNVSFIEGVTLSTSSMHARYDNALSSVLQFDQRTGNPNKFQGNFRLSSTEAAMTLEGPIQKKVTYLASVRRSYLEYLFQAIDLPIRPNYWDFQYKVNYKLNNKTSFNFIGLGALDDFSFAVPKNSTPEKEYTLRSNPLIHQGSYTTGVSMKHLVKQGYLRVALSRNMFKNRLDKFDDGQDGVEEYRSLKSVSKEIENKLRVEMNQYDDKWRFSYGGSIQYVKYNNDFFRKVTNEVKNNQGEVIIPRTTVNFDTDINFAKIGLFGQVSRRFMDNKLNVSLGTRTDLNTFTKTGMNPLETWAFRLGTRYELSDKWGLNASAGSYYKIPIYTILGYKDDNGNYTNENADYTEAYHYVLGTEYIANTHLRFTLEGFYKQYNNYPVSASTGVSLANQGGNFGAIGNENILTIGKGRAYGVEFFAQQKLTKNIFAVFSYTGYKSEFTGTDTQKYIASAWDYGHLVSLNVGYKFKRGWEIGAKYRFAAGAPYTPFDMAASLQQYYITGVGVPDYTQLNSKKLPTFNQVDIRIDKKWNFKKVTFDLYLDITNALALTNYSAPQYTWKRKDDNSDWFTTDGQNIQLDGSNASPLLLENTSRLVTPSLGFIVEF